jgi:hypothetical protein
MILIQTTRSNFLSRDGYVLFKLMSVWRLVWRYRDTVRCKRIDHSFVVQSINYIFCLKCYYWYVNSRDLCNAIFLSLFLSRFPTVKEMVRANPDLEEIESSKLTSKPANKNKSLLSFVIPSFWCFVCYNLFTHDLYNIYTIFFCSLHLPTSGM